MKFTIIAFAKERTIDFSFIPDTIMIKSIPNIHKKPKRKQFHPITYA